MPPEVVRAACDQAHELGFCVCAHMESTEGVRVFGFAAMALADGNLAGRLVFVHQLRRHVLDGYPSSAIVSASLWSYLMKVSIAILLRSVLNMLMSSLSHFRSKFSTAVPTINF